MSCCEQAPDCQTPVALSLVVKLCPALTADLVAYCVEHDVQPDVLVRRLLAEEIPR